MQKLRRTAVKNRKTYNNNPIIKNLLIPGLANRRLSGTQQLVSVEYWQTFQKYVYNGIEEEVSYLI